MLALDKAQMYWRFARDLRKYLREPLTTEQSHQTIRQRLTEREKSLVSVVRRAIYDNEKSPYLKMLKMAGCEYGDFERMVLADGVENTLMNLYQSGV